MRISDWSSDVCSSDLADAVARLVRRMRLLEIDRQTAPRRPGIPAKRVFGLYGIALLAITFLGVSPAISFLAAALAIRSEERSVGKACVISCRTRGSPCHYKKNSDKCNKLLRSN